MLESMALRGPDDEGLAEPRPADGEHHLLMGATRLALLDRSPAGRQSFCEEGIARLHDHQAVPVALWEMAWPEQAAPSPQWRKAHAS